MGSDGLLDNVFKDEVLTLISQRLPELASLTKEKQAEVLALEIAYLAK